jgi:hypothetical protein
MSRKAAERLLAGAAGAADAPGRLGHVLAAATAPARDSELAREEAVLAAFDAAALSPVPAPVAAATGAGTTRSRIGRRLTVKVAAVSLAVVTTGGVALAASTGAFTGSGPVHHDGRGGGAPVVSSPVSSPAQVSVSPSARASSSPSGQSSPTSKPAPVVVALSVLCRRLADTAQAASAGLGEATRLENGLASSGLPGLLARPAFSPLAAAAQGAANVPDYCGLLLRLPRLPLPGELGQLPTRLLSAGLTRLPAATLAQVLTSLPAGELGQALSRLPSAVAGPLLSKLPVGALGSVLNRLSDHDLSAVLGKLPSPLLNTLLGKLPADVLSKILARLPSTLLSRLSGSLLSVLHL